MIMSRYNFGVSVTDRYAFEPTLRNVTSKLQTVSDRYRILPLLALQVRLRSLQALPVVI